MLFNTFPTTQSDFPQPLAEQGHSAVLEGNFLGRNRSAWRVPEAIVAAEVVVEVASIVDAEVVLVVGRVVGIGVGVVGGQGERLDVAAEEGRIVEVVANMIVVAADGVCRELVAGAGIESIVVDMQLREVLAEGRAVGHMVDAG
jgi:hypothetical protein